MVKVASLQRTRNFGCSLCAILLVWSLTFWGGSTMARLAGDDDTNVVHIEIRNFEFRAVDAGNSDPDKEAADKIPTVKIPKGTKVVWTNWDPFGHDVVFEPHPHFGTEPPRSPLLEEGESWEWVFDEPGEYWYYCSPHPFMQARIIVTGDVED